MGRKSLKEDRQKEIIKGFYQIAKKEGLENVSIGKLAKHLDMQPTLILHYFDNKVALTMGLIDYIIDKYRKIYIPKDNHKSQPLEALMDIINNIFSRKWNRLFDDGLYFSCYAMIYRDKTILEKFQDIHRLLRKWLTDIVQQCIDQKLLGINDAQRASNLIFVISDGAYYYLGMITDKAEYQQKLEEYKKEAIKILQIKSESFLT
jgi:AcrR family transcriptional regulator